MARLKPALSKLFVRKVNFPHPQGSSTALRSGRNDRVISLPEVASAASPPTFAKDAKVGHPALWFGEEEPHWQDGLTGMFGWAWECRDPLGRLGAGSSLGVAGFAWDSAASG